MINKDNVRLIKYFLVFVILLFPRLTSANQNSDCLECHEETESERAIGYEESLTLSIHQDFDCIDCHADLDGIELPHDEELENVDCGICHEDAAETYIGHGRKSVKECVDIPCCAECHGKHDILPSSDKNSFTNPLNLPSTCGRCHEDLNLTKRHEILYGKAVAVYKSSVHGKAAMGGIYFAATCNDCHSTGGSAHRILGPGDQESTINHFNIPKTCGKCHKAIEQDFWDGIHGKLVKRGETDAPICTDCHGEHGIVSPSNPQSRVSPARVAEATCAPCHESARLNEKYGTPTKRLQTWIDSYHGLKSKAGDMTVANCASCHGAHRILPHTDSTSSIHPDNLVVTCGGCHLGISAEMATTPIHSAPGISQTPIANIVRQIYIIIIIVTIGLMVLHWLVDLRREIKKVRQKPQMTRMNQNEVWQHHFLMISFIVLVLSGFALRFSEAFWVQWLFGWEGGFPLRGILHRIAAVVLMIAAIWHFIYLWTPRGKQFIRDMIPNRTDWNHVIQLVGYNLGLKDKKPQFGRFTYIEKFEYWSLIWGTIVMIITGLLLWFDNITIIWVPKGFLDVMLVIHYYEAWLAALAILIWHMYSTIFNPGIYPMNPAWLDGKMPLEMYKHEHPADPVLKNIEREK
ncbi:MAG: hypothetical protein DRP51_06800 [Candidatus Zixiibacteriota bacterium]|nr:MAG: hypothetical protein DRP51_06800 [candidate division Zixibacteria bacterium]